MQETGEKTVVVVDDDASMCEYLSETLALGGYDCARVPPASVRMVGDGDEALNAIQDEQLTLF